MAAIAPFLADSDLFNVEKPYTYNERGLGQPKTNISKEEQTLCIIDLRCLPEQDQPTLESHGLCVVKQKSAELDKVVDVASSQSYAMEMSQLVKDLLGATKVIPVQTLLRTTSREKCADIHDRPADVAHIDMGIYASWSFILRLIPEEDHKLLISGNWRARIFNFWRPRLNNAEDVPLALLDPATLSDHDQVAVDTVIPTAASETVYLRHNENQRWFWLSNQTPDEAFLFTQYDTHPPANGPKRVGHTAFRNEARRKDCPPRSSIELRLVVLEPAPYKKSEPGERSPPEEMRRQPWKDFIQLPKEVPNKRALPNFARKGKGGHISSSEVEVD